MKKIFLFVVFLFTVTLSFSQSDKQLTHYMFDRMSFNPATTGFKGYCATVIYRGQWDKVENAPNTFLGNLQGNIPGTNHGVGLSFMSDVIGYGKENDVKLTYAYHHHVQGYGFLSGGLGLGITNIGFDPKWNAPQTGTDVSLDPTLPLGAGGTAFDVNMGVHWKGESIPYYVGLSMTHLTSPSLKNVNFTKARHYYIMAGYDIANVYPLPDRLTISPSVLFKTDMTAGILDVNVLADYWFSNKMQGIFGGLTYRNKDAFAIMVGFQLNIVNSNGNLNTGGSLKGPADVLKFGYSYDIMTGPLNEYGSGSHEMMFNYCMFAPPKPVQRHGNVFILQ